MFIAGGSQTSGTSRKSYALSLDSEVQVPECLASIPDFPLDGYEPESAVLSDGSPFVCSSAGELLFFNNQVCSMKLPRSPLQIAIADATNTTTLAWTGSRLRRSPSKDFSILVSTPQQQFSAHVKHLQDSIKIPIRF